MAVPPAVLIIAAVSSIVSGRPYGDGLPLTLRPVQYTVAPASASARAMPRPAPRVAPATRATRPVSGLWEDLFFAMFTMSAGWRHRRPLRKRVPKPELMRVEGP